MAGSGEAKSREAPEPGRPSPESGSGSRRAFVLTAAPVLAYLFTFTYEAGFVGQFGIPLQVITLNWTVVFVVAGALFFALVPVLLIVNILSAAFPPEPDGAWLRRIKHPAARRAVFIAPGLAIGGVLGFLYGLELWREWVPYIIAFAALAALQFLLPVLLHWKEPTYKQKMIASDKRDAQIVTLLDRGIHAIGLANSFLLVLLAFGLLVAFSAGRAQAMRERSYFVIQPENDEVVLRIYGDKLVTADLERAEHRVGRAIRLRSLSGSEGLSLRLQKVGPLTTTKPSPRATPSSKDRSPKPASPKNTPPA